MARVSYAGLQAPEAAQAAASIAATRAGGKLLNVDKVLLHSPALALGWRAFFSAVRTQCGLPDTLRELITLRVAVLNRAEYEFAQHGAIALRLGYTPAQLGEIRTLHPENFLPLELLAIELCDAMTHDIQVPEDLVARLRKHLDERALVELVVTVSAYNCVSRTLEALQIENE